MQIPVLRRSLPAFGRVLAAAAITACLPAVTWPQSKPLSVRTGPGNLAEALAHLSPESAGRLGVPLLIIDPAGTPLPRGAKSLPPPRAGYRVTDLAAAFDRKMVRLPTLTALAPTRMVVLNTDPPQKPDLLAGTPRVQRLRMLLVSLTPEQWRRLCGAQGLGIADVSLKQRPVLLSLLPEPFRWRMMRGGRMLSLNTLSPNERLQARLRLGVTARVWATRQGSSGDGGGADLLDTGDAATLRGEEPFPAFGGPPDPDPTVSPPESDWTYRVDLFPRAVNRLKRGHLNLDASALDRSVSLEGAQTVGDLVGRVGAAVGAELHADTRVARLPVWIQSEEPRARAGDVLKALCYGVTGTFRKVGPVYLLTDDVSGIVERRERIHAWRGGLGRQTGARNRELRTIFIKSRPARFLGCSPETRDTLGSRVCDVVEDDLRSAGDRDQFTYTRSVLLSDFPGATRERIAARIAERTAERKYGERYRADAVRMSFRVSVSYVLPKVGAMDSGILIYPNDFLPDPPKTPQTPPPAPPPVTLPPSLAADSALLIAPATAEEARRAVLSAKRHGLTRLWVDVPENPGEEQAILTAAVTAGKEAGIPIFAVVRLLRIAPPPKDCPLAGALDRDALGLTSQEYFLRRMTPHPLIVLHRPDEEHRVWLRPDAPATRQFLKERLLRVAATPGLSGLVLRDSTVPGYAHPSDRDAYVSGWSGGCASEEMRVAAIRAAGVDPLDFTTEYESPRPWLPFFPNRLLSRGYLRVAGYTTAAPEPQKSPLQTWNGLRYEANTRLLIDLFGIVRAAHPNLSLLLRERTTDARSMNNISLRPGWFGSWDRADVLPSYLPTLSFEPPSRGQVARAQSRRVLLDVFVSPLYAAPSLFNGPTPVDPLEQAGAARLLIYAIGLPTDLTVPLVKASPVALGPYASMYLGNILKREKQERWDGLVLDMSDMTAKDALSLLPQALATSSESGAEPAPP